MKAKDHHMRYLDKKIVRMVFYLSGILSAVSLNVFADTYLDSGLQNTLMPISSVPNAKLYTPDQGSRLAFICKKEIEGKSQLGLYIKSKYAISFSKNYIQHRILEIASHIFTKRFLLGNQGQVFARSLNVEVRIGVMEEGFNLELFGPTKHLFPVALQCIDFLKNIHLISQEALNITLAGFLEKEWYFPLKPELQKLSDVHFQRFSKYLDGNVDLSLCPHTVQHLITNCWNEIILWPSSDTDLNIMRNSMHVLDLETFMEFFRKDLWVEAVLVGNFLENDVLMAWDLFCETIEVNPKSDLQHHSESVSIPRGFHTRTMEINPLNPTHAVCLIAEVGPSTAIFLTATTFSCEIVTERIRNFFKSMGISQETVEIRTMAFDTLGKVGICVCIWSDSMQGNQLKTLLEGFLSGEQSKSHSNVFDEQTLIQSLQKTTSLATLFPQLDLPPSYEYAALSLLTLIRPCELNFLEKAQFVISKMNVSVTNLLLEEVWNLRRALLVYTTKSLPEHETIDLSRLLE